jgi:hypothetical protein
MNPPLRPLFNLKKPHVQITLGQKLNKKNYYKSNPIFNWGIKGQKPVLPSESK